MNWLPRKQFIFLIFLLCHGLGIVHAQLEINVKVLPSAAQVRATLEKINKGNEQILPATMAEFLPKGSHLVQARPLQVNSPERSSGLEGIYTLDIQGSSMEETLRKLKASGNFEFVEENRLLRIHGFLGDPPNDDSIASQWYHPKIRTFEAWKISQGSPQVKIGVLDTGLDFRHPEFENQVYVNPLEDVNSNGKMDAWPSTEQRNGVTGDFDGLDNDGNGYIDDVSGYDFTDQPRNPFGGDYLFEDPFPEDDNGHGTLVAGVISARANNQYGGAGIAPGCKLVPIRAIGRSGNGENDDMARAIVYAADNGIHILNLSFGDIFPSQILHEAIKYAYGKGVVMVASAGNGNGDDLHYPSGFAEVISVSATAQDDSGNEFLWPLSSYGLTVDLSAPGSDIFVPMLRDTADDGSVEAFTITQGTSFSAPMVSAAVGLLFSVKGVLSPEQARGILTSTSDDLAEKGWDHFTGAGRLNIEKALEYVSVSEVQLLSPSNDGGSALDRVAIVGTAVDPEFLRYHVEYKPGTEDVGEWIPILMDQVYQVKEDTLAWWNLEELPEGAYTLRLRVEKSNGATAEDRIRFVRDTSTPEIDIMVASPAWDNAERGMLFVFRASDQGRQELLYRRKGLQEFRVVTLDRITRNGDFLLGRKELLDGEYEFKIRCTNLSGLVGESPLGDFSFQNASIPTDSYQPLSYTLPMGRYLPEAYDMDGDGLKEAIMSRYSESLSFGKLMFYEFNGGKFTAVDSIASKPILIPKDVADTDGDNLLELLASVNDSITIYEQALNGVFPHEIIFKDEGNERFAAAFADTDGDGDEELLAKDFKDYYIYEGGGANFVETTVLEDESPQYEGSIAPRVLVEDFDKDGRQEVVYGDFDGDLIVYEHQQGGQYQLTFVDTTDLQKGGTYLVKGDFDGDGTREIFIAVHTNFLKNPDKEYDVFYWWLRILKPIRDNQFEPVWESYLYDRDTESYNAATGGNLDNDLADELVFTTFPRTYIIEHNGLGYEMSWFQYGDLATHHLIGDYNLNGINEVLIGRGDTAFFYEKNLNLTGPQAVYSLKASVLGEQSIRLDWQLSPTANSYDIWRVIDPLNNTNAEILRGITGTSFIDNSLQPGTLYLYVLRAINPTLSPRESGFGNFVLVQPHARPVVDSLQPVSAKQLEVYLSQPYAARPNDVQRFRLNGQHTASNVLMAGAEDRRLLVSFPYPFNNGNNTLGIDTTLQDAGLAFLHPSSAQTDFLFEATDEEHLIISRWEHAGDKEAILFFNFPLDEKSALDTANYAISPFGWPKQIAWYGEDNDAVIISIEKARIGALGYAVSISVDNVCAITDVCIDKTGNTATFSSHKEDLSEVFAYPNPVRKHSAFEGMRFANLTEQATIKVYSVSGQYVRTIEETDGDGGVEWDMHNLANERIKPGIYLYHVSTKQSGVQDFLGKFSVIE